jgi:hypothetical protein
VLVMIFVAGTNMYAHLPAFWPIPSMFLGVVAAASAIGFINMIGNLGGTTGPVIVGTAVTKDISAVKNFLANGSNKVREPVEANPIWARLNSAHSLEEIRQVRASAALPPSLQLTDDQAKLFVNVDRSMEEGNKLSTPELQRVSTLLSAAALRLPLDKDQQEELIALLGRGASFAPGLRRLAIWPILAAAIILIVGYYRRWSERRRAVAAPQPAA